MFCFPLVSVMILFMMLIAQLVFTTPSSSSTNKESTFERLEGFEFVGHVMETLSADEFRCGLRCLRKENCESYNSHTNGVCQLSNHTRQLSPDRLRHRTGSTYYGKVKDFLGWFPYYPGHSCKHIRDSGNSKGNGEYWIDPEMNGNPLKVYCDMTSAGGGWLLILNIVTQDSLSLTLNSPETSYRKIDNYRNEKMIIDNSAINELRSHLSFTQLRFHCSKQYGRTFHVTTVANSTGEAVIQYFTGQTETMPASCGSFERMKDDNSYLSRNCAQWGKDDEGNFYSGTWSHQGKSELYDHPAFIVNAYHWITLPDVHRYECDDFVNLLSPGDFWRVYVR